MDSYKKLVKKIIDDGERKQNRTGIDTISITGYMFEHDMSEGFPLLTSKKMAYKSIFSELEFFIKGYHNKDWLKEHKNHIWDEWCSPILQPYGNDEKTKEKMKSISELGPIYGVQWRNFDGKQYFDENLNEMYSDEFSKGVAQRGMIDFDHIENNKSKYGSDEDLINFILMALKSGAIDQSAIVQTTSRLSQANRAMKQEADYMNITQQSLLNEY